MPFIVSYTIKFVSMPVKGHTCRWVEKYLEVRLLLNNENFKIFILMYSVNLSIFLEFNVDGRLIKLIEKEL